ncbi:MAG: NPCBM/NEW2 domain-containing protein [Planctomycetaceae bacterium]|nr:NPCBM/NEW2 domain-containing protein [Planctomycetaceae bacterium]
MMSRLCILAAWGITFLGSSPLLAASDSAPTWVITTATGEKHEAEALNIAHRNLLLGRRQQLKKFEPDQILSIARRNEKPLAGVSSLVRRGCRVSLSNGDRYFGRLIDLTDTAITLDPFLKASPESGETEQETFLSFPLEYVLELNWFRETMRSGMDRSTASSQPVNQDLITLSNGDRIAGELTEFSATALQLETENGSREIQVEAIQSLRLNPELVIAVPASSSQILVRLQDGSRITSESLDLVDFNQLRLKTSFSKPWSISLSHLKSLLVLDEARRPLSTREPADVKYTPFLSQVPLWQADRNVLGQPLRMQSVEYLTGLGMHSQTELTWNLQPDDLTFLAEIGLDDLTEGAGSVRFEVLTNDEVVFESGLVRGGTPPRSISIDLADKQTLTLRVLFGEQGDVQDRADWGHALILKSPVVK